MALQMLIETKPSAWESDVGEWQQWCLDEGFPRYVAGQILEWIFKKNCLHPKEFTNLSLVVRQRLIDSFNWELLAIHARLPSQDGSEKLLLQTEDKKLLEMVIMPYEGRTTLCLSSQVGCKMACTFCQTGKMGFTRNLTAAEILSQILLANALLGDKGRITNVVFMGMGEPLDNYEAVIKACRRMIDPKALGLSKAKVTISTSGLVPEIYRLGRDLPVRLAISLHAAKDDRRSAMMPINRKYPLDVLKKALLNYPAPERYGITFEYVMIEGVNDSLVEAKQLVKFLHGLKAKVNLIPINHFPGLAMRPSQTLAIEQFQKYLSERGIPSPVRYSRAQDVSGGCGQLAAKAKEDLHKDPRELARERRVQERLR